MDRIRNKYIYIYSFMIIKTDLQSKYYMKNTIYQKTLSSLNNYTKNVHQTIKKKNILFYSYD